MAETWVLQIKEQINKIEYTHQITYGNNIGHNENHNLVQITTLFAYVWLRY